MIYPESQKIKGSNGYNGFKLNSEEYYLEPRLKKASSIMAKAKDLKLHTYHFIVDSKGASVAANKIRKLKKQACCYVGYEIQSGTHELFIFCRESLEQVEKILNKHYQYVECCGEYDLAQYVDLIEVAELCFSYCVDNESDGDHKRYFCPSQLTDIEKLREIKMMPMVVDKASSCFKS